MMEQMAKKRREEAIKALTPGEVPEQWQYIRDQFKVWDELNFNDQMERPIEPLFSQASMSADDVDGVFEIGAITADKIGSVSATAMQTALDSLVKVSSLTEASSGSIATGTGVRLTSTLSDDDNPSRKMMGVCESNAYMGSVASNTVIPWGSDAIATGHHWATHYSARDSNGVNIAYTHHIQNTTGSSHVYVFRVRWRYIGSVSVT